MPAEKACPADEMLPPGVVCPLWLPFTNDLDDMRYFYFRQRFIDLK